jgi:hypothetical protein
MESVLEPAQKRARYEAAATEPRVTKLVFADGALCAGKNDLLVNLRIHLEETNYNVYEFPDVIGLPKMFVDKVENRLVRMGEIMQEYADCRGADWDNLLDRLREATSYEFNRYRCEVDSMATVCESIEAARQQAKTVAAYESCPSEEDM